MADGIALTPSVQRPDASANRFGPPRAPTCGGSTGPTGGFDVERGSGLWRASRLGAAVVGLVLVSTACLGGGNNNNNENASPGASVAPTTAADPDHPVTITFSSWVGDSDIMKQFANDFHDQHPNITVEFQAVSSDNSTTKLTTQVAGGTAPDVAYMDAGAVQTFASRGAL